MAKRIKHTKYDTYKLPEGITSLVDEIIKGKGGFTSRTDVVKQAVRDLYRSMNYG